MRGRVVFIVVMFLAGAAFAQVDAHRDEIRRLSADIGAVEAAVGEETQDDARLLDLRTRLEALSKGLLGFGVSLRPRLTEINARIEALGPPPREGDSQEPEIVVEERRALAEEKAQINALLGEAEALSIRASRTVDEIAALRRQLFTDTLLKQTDFDGVLGADVWRAFVDEMGVVRRQVVARAQFVYAFSRESLVLAAGLSILLALAAAFALKRLFGAFISQEEPVGESSYIGNLSLAFWATVIPSAVVAASLAVAYTLFVYFGILARQTREIVEALLVLIAAAFFMQRLARALFAPGRPERRLIMVSDRAAGPLVALTVGVAVIHVLDQFLGRIDAIFSAPLSLTVAKSLLSSVVISVLLILIALVKPFQGEGGRARGWPAYIRLPLLGAAVFIIGAAAFGYIGLARFAAAQIVVTGAILATMYIGVQSGQVLAAEGAFPQSSFGRRVKERFAVSDTVLDQIGIVASFIVYGLVFLTGIPLIMLQWGFSWVDIQGWLYKLLTEVRIGSITISVVGILFGLVVFVLGFLFTRRFQAWLDGSVMARGRLDPGVRNSIHTIVGYLGIAIAALIGLSAAGFDLSNLAIIAGALSLGIGFGLQNIVNNFVSGLILLAERPFKVGDWIVAGNTTGVVKKVSVRATEIETFQRQTVILPNSELINSAVGNWTHRNPWGRVDIKVGAPYGADPRRVHELLLDIAAADPAVLKTPAPAAVFLGFGDSALDFELRVHIAAITESVAVSTRLRFEIYDAFEANGISMPFPQRDVNLRLPDLEALVDALDVVRAARDAKASATSRPAGGE